MNKDINNLPIERKLNPIQLFLRWPTLALIISLVFVGVGGYVTYLGLTATEEDKLTVLICGAVFALAGLFFTTIISKIMFEYVSVVKKGERIFVDIISTSNEGFFVKDDQNQNYEISAPKILARKYSNYSIIPAFRYKHHVYADWENITQFGSTSTIDQAEVYKQTKEDFSIAKIAQERARNIVSSDMEKSYNSKLFSPLSTYLVGGIVILVLFLPSSIEYLSSLKNNPQFDILYTIYLFISFIGVCNIFMALISSLSLFKYSKAKNNGEKIVSNITMYHSLSNYKGRKVKLLVNPSLLVGGGAIMEFEYISKYDGLSYKGICSFSSFYYKKLKEETALPAILYKNKVYPDWNAISEYLEIKNEQNSQVE